MEQNTLTCYVPKNKQTHKQTRKSYKETRDSPIPNDEITQSTLADQNYTTCTPGEGLCLIKWHENGLVLQRAGALSHYPYGLALLR